MTLAVEFNFTPADARDPESQSDCEIVSIRLNDAKLPFRVSNDMHITSHLLALLYRLRQIMPR